MWPWSEIKHLKTEVAGWRVAYDSLFAKYNRSSTSEHVLRQSLKVAQDQRDAAEKELVSVRNQLAAASKNDCRDPKTGRYRKTTAALIADGEKEMKFMWPDRVGQWDDME